MDRRQFLARTGLLGTGMFLARGGVALAQEPDDVLGPILDGGAEVSQTLARDTFSGLVAFVVPGEGPYSQAQGVTVPGPGGIEARTPDFILSSVDNFYPLHDGMVRSLVAAFNTGMEDSGAPIPQEFLDAGNDVATQLDEAVEQILENDQTVPLTVLIAMMMNQLAVMVDPSSVAGPFPSPFANLTYEQKGEAWELLEQPNSDLVAMIDSQLPEPMTATVSGMLKFVAGALLEFVAFGTYTEFSTFDRETRDLTGTPVGWQLSRYLVDSGFQPVEGWDEFLGFYQGRTEVTG